MPRRDLFLLFALALLLNFAAASLIQEPGGVDDAYYFGGALRLAQGHGFTEPYLWNYLGNPQLLPQPSHLYWMPLTSIVAAASMFLFGQSFAAARFPLVVLASLLPLIAYAIAWRAGGLRRHAVCAGLLAAFSGYYAIYWGTTDSFALYGVVGGLALLGIGLASEKRDWRWAVAAGIGVGLAHLTRADGILLLIVGIWSLAASRPPSVVHPTPLRFGDYRRPSRSASLRGLSSSIPLRFAPGTIVAFRLSSFLAGYALLMLPWFARNVVAAGSPFGNGGLSTLWLIEYNDIFNYPSNLSPARYFAAGWQTILAGKWEALVTNFQIILAVQGLIFLAPLTAIGLWQLRRHPLYRPALLYAVLLYAAMTLAFTFPGPRGGLFHSGAALIPFYFSAAFVGLDAAIDWIAARRPRWQPEQARRIFSGAAVGLAVTLTFIIALPNLMGWSGEGAVFREIGAAIPAEAVVMSNNPPGFWVATGHPGVPLVNGDPPNLLAAADRFSTRYVLLDANHPAGLAELYVNESGERLRLRRRWGDRKLFEVIP